jgi:hypothetical protein
VDGLRPYQLLGVAGGLGACFTGAGKRWAGGLAGEWPELGWAARLMWWAEPERHPARLSMLAGGLQSIWGSSAEVGCWCCVWCRMTGAGCHHCGWRGGYRCSGDVRFGCDGDPMGAGRWWRTRSWIAATRVAGGCSGLCWVTGGPGRCRCGGRLSCLVRLAGALEGGHGQVVRAVGRDPRLAANLGTV